MSERLPVVNLQGTGYLWNGGEAFGRRFLRALSFHEPVGLAAVLDDSGAYHIDVTGTPRYTQRYLDTFGFYCDASTVRDDRGYFHINPQGRPLHEERYQWAGNFQEGLCPAQDESGLFHIDLRGAPAYEDRYEYVGDFVHGVAVAYADRRAFHIHRDGSRLHGETFLQTGVFHKGFAVAEDEGGAYHVDLDGKPVHAHRFAAAEPFYNGVALCRRKDGRLIRVRENGHYIHLPPLHGRIDVARMRARIEAGERVGLLVRHAERQPITTGWGNQAPLTKAGIAQAQRLGECLAGLPQVKVYSSPIHRCVQTGHSFSKGAGHPQDPTTTHLLGDPGPFADPARAHEMQVGPREFGDFGTRYVTVGRAPGMHPLEVACDGLLDGLQRRLGRGLTVFVTHDLFVAGLASFLGLKIPTRQDWADYLEAVCICVAPDGHTEWQRFLGLEELGTC